MTPTLPPPLLFKIFFYKNAVNKQKLSIELVRNLSKSAGNSHFRRLKFSKSSGRACPETPLKSRPFGARCATLPIFKVLDPLEISHAQQFFNLGISANRGFAGGRQQVKCTNTQFCARNSRDSLATSCCIFR